MAKPINMLAGLRNLAAPGKAEKNAIVVKLEGDGLFFDPSDKPMAAAMTAAILAQIKTNLARGAGPGGQQLPALTSATIRRRELEVDQAQRGGAADERFVDGQFRALVQQNYDRDYTAAKLGKFEPQRGTVRGVLSGMLLNSLFARPNRDGRGFTVNVAAKRGRPRPAKTNRRPEDKSALESVFGDVPLWDKGAQNSPAMRQALKESADNMIGKTLGQLRKSALKLLKEMRQTFAGLAELSE